MAHAGRCHKCEISFYTLDELEIHNKEFHPTPAEKNRAEKDRVRKELAKLQFEVAEMKGADKQSSGVIVHLAGTEITFDALARQRCLWCGTLIDERDWSRIAVDVPEGKTLEEAVSDQRKTIWRGFVAVDGITLYAVPHDDLKPPAGSCMLLDPEVTK